MAKGEVPISYIIALILGISVVAVIGYWFFYVQNIGGGEMNADQCKSKAYEYCRTWEANLYAGSDSDTPNVGGFIGNKWFATPPKGGDSSSVYVAQCSKNNPLSGDGGTKATALMNSCKALLA